MNHWELPATSVSALAIQPPVQDSAVATARRLAQQMPADASGEPCKIVIRVAHRVRI